ncbi:MAG TPA: family 20 glycosylhydrolase [Chthonomonadaceae bacterium]|nr:family 20 glycosylhydrolase [Chthonomonadaceae bacterium]
MQTREGTFHSDTAPALLVGRSLEEANTPAFLPLKEGLQSRFGTAPDPQTPGKHLPLTPFVLIGLERDNPALRQLVAAHRAELPKGGLGAEGYILDVTPEHVLIVAEKPAGAYYGARKLLEMDRAGGKGLDIPAGTVVDWPAMAWRGMHILVNGRTDIPALETLLTQQMPRYRLNTLIVEIDYHFQFKSHPEVTEGDALSRDDCRHLKALADQNYIRLIPMINCLGHQSWAANTGQLLKAHPEFDETPDVPADNKGIYCRSWCPSNPDVYKVVDDLTDELVDAFDANAFHVGMDEVFLIGKCPRCKGEDNATLFAKAVNTLHAHIVGQRHLQMLMWGDRLLDGKATGYGEWEASENGTFPAIDRIPKDIVLCDWHYETQYDDKPATYPSVAYFQEKGFRVWPSGWNSAENARMLTACSLKNRTERMVGYLATTWGSVVNITGGLAGDANLLSNKEIAGIVDGIKEGARDAWEGD